MNEPLLELKRFGVKVKVYPDRVVYKKPLGFGEISVPIENISSVEVGSFLSAAVNVRMTGGEKIRFVVKTKDKEAFKEAIYKAKEMRSKR